MITISSFKGMVPKLHPGQLPEGGSQLLHNLVATSGALEPLRVDGPFSSYHTADGLLTSGIGVNELPVIAKPAAPTLRRKMMRCQPGGDLGNWLRITLVSFVSLVDANGVRQAFVHHAVPLSWRYWHTETGLVIRAWATGLSPAIFFRGGPYFFHGPRFMFSFGQAPGQYGGPSEAHVIPEYVLPTSPAYSAISVPLVGPDSNVYGEFEVSDYAGPWWDEDFYIDRYDVYTYVFGSFACTFRIDLNYAQPKRQHYFYVTSNVDALDREGPPSSISERMVARPGEVVSVLTPHAADHKVRLYRSGTGHDDFLLLDEGTWDSFDDTPVPTRTEEIQPFGNWNGSGAPDVATFARGSVLHPGGFGVAFYGKTVWHSDIYRLHSWPEKNTTPYLEAVKAIALAGDRVLVFAGDKVYSESGPDPEHMSGYQISDTAPLLNILGLCKIGNVVYWPTYDGLAACDGSRVEIITSKWMTRQQWLELNPAQMSAETADGCVYLRATFTPATPPPQDRTGILTPITMRMLSSYVKGALPGNNAVNVRIDLNDEAAPFSTFEAYEGGYGTWRTGVYTFPVDTRVDFLRVTGTGPVTVIGTLDGVDQAPVVAANDGLVKVDWGPFRHMAITLQMACTVTRLELYDRKVAAGQDVMVFTPETTPSFRDVRVSWPEAQWLGALILSSQSAGPVTVRVYDGESLAPWFEQAVSGGEAVPLPIETRVKGSYWRVSVDSDVQTDQLVLAREVQAPSGEFVQEAHAGQIAPWLLKVYTWDRPVQMRSVRVVARGNVTMQLYYDGAVEASEEVEIRGAYEYRVVSDSIKSLRIRFVGDGDAAADGLVDHVTVSASAPIEAPADGVHLQGSPAWRRQVYRFGERSRYSAIGVVADAYPVYVDIYEVGRSTARYTVTLRDEKTVALPWDVAVESTLWEFDLRDKGDDLRTRVHGMHLYGRRGVAVDGGVIDAVNSGGAAPWLIARYEYKELTYWRSMKVETEGGQAVYMKLYVDGVEQEELIELASGVERYLTSFSSVLSGRQLEFRFVSGAMLRPADHFVKRVTIYGANPEAAGDAVQVTGHPWLWREYRFAHMGRFTACQLIMRDGYEGTAVRIRFSAGGVEYEVTPGRAEVFALPSMVISAIWTVSVEGGEAIERLVLYTEGTIQSDGNTEGHAVPGAPDWLRLRWEMDRPTVIAAVKVESSAYPVTLRANLDGVTRDVEVTGSGWTATGWSTPRSAMTLRVLQGGVGADHLVRCVRTFAQQETEVGPDGLVWLKGLPCYTGLRFRFPQTGAWAGVSVDADAAATVTLSRLDGAAYAVSGTTGADEPKLTRVYYGSKEGSIKSPTYGSLWELNVACTGTVRSVLLLAWKREQSAGVVGVRDTGAVPGWYHTRFDFGENRVPRSVRVIGDVDVDVYCGTDKESFEAEVYEQRIADRHECREVVVDFEEIVAGQGVYVACEEHVAVPATGYVLRQADGVPFWRNKVLRFNEPGTFGVVRARHADQVRLRHFGDSGWTTVTIDETDYTAIAPVLTAAREWELDVVCSSDEQPVVEVLLFARVSHDVKKGSVLISKSGDPFCWLDLRIRSERPIDFSAARVAATGSVTMTVRDWGRNVLYSRTFSGSGLDRGLRLPKGDLRRDWVVDLVPASEGTEIRELALGTSMGALG
jgi:hypothetical protein